MKRMKSLLALGLALAMAAFCLTGCSGTSEEEAASEAVEELYIASQVHQLLHPGGQLHHGDQLCHQ